MRTKRAWSMPKDEARSVLRVIEERIRSSEITVQRRDALIRLRQVIEEELAAADRGQEFSADQERSAA